jgi:hypothetical protein
MTFIPFSEPLSATDPPSERRPSLPIFMDRT